MRTPCLLVASAHGSPFWIAWALQGEGRAFAQHDADRALAAFRRGLAFVREHRLVLLEARLARDAAELEALHGNPDDGLALFDRTVTAFHRAGEQAGVEVTIANLVVFFDRFGESRAGATLLGVVAGRPAAQLVAALSTAEANLRSALDGHDFDTCWRQGAAMDHGAAVAFARLNIHRMAERAAEHR